MSVLYLFSGAQRKSSVTSVLVRLCHHQGVQCTVHEVDIQNSPEWDLTKGAVQQSLLQRIRQEEFDVVLITPPCSTWSRVRGANCRGPPAIRSRGYPWGFPWLSTRHQRDADLGNILIVFMLDVLEALEAHPMSAAGSLVLLFGEHPEDLGVITREEDGMVMEPASIWQLDRLREVAKPNNALQLFTVVFNQCCWGAPYRKPTRLLSNIDNLQSWGSCEWPQFDAHHHYVGPRLSCQCQPTVSLARHRDDSVFRTATTAAYPAAMDKALAKAIFSAWLSAPHPPAKEGGEGGGQQEKEKKHLGGGQQEKEKKHLSASDQREKKRPLPSSNEGGPPPKARKGARKTSVGQEEVVTEKSALRPAEGPPMQVSYKGERRALHDGAGLCSPGRWPVEKRRLPATEREVATVV